jgi:4-hydroxy-3-methylbut-2-en-1-yl diphosphate synthase IspG/GcpE
VIQAAKDNGCSMRIGVNAGSLEKDLLEKYGEPCPDAMVESALNHARILQDHDFHEFKISVKASDPFLTVAAYQQLAEAIDCPLHLGVTEAGRCAPAPSSRRHRDGVDAVGTGSATRSASPWPPIRSRRSRSASTS